MFEIDVLFFVDCDGGNIFVDKVLFVIHFKIIQIIIGHFMITQVDQFWFCTIIYESSLILMAPDLTYL